MIYFVILLAILFAMFNYQVGKLKYEKSLNPNDEVDASKWEIVERNSERWNELGFGDGGLFPGYGKIYDREFKVWYCEVGSKEEKDQQLFHDRFPINYSPKDYRVITGEDVYVDRLNKTRGFEFLFSGLDNKNKKRWYFALVKSTPTWIETKRADTELEIEKEEEEELEEIPEGWHLVRNHSEKWDELRYDNGFPGYGKIYDITFEVWYIGVGSKERIKQPDISIHLAPYGDDLKIYTFKRICKSVKGLENKQLSFDRLSKTQGYLQLYSGLDNSRKNRWYLGVREMRPTYFYTSSAE